MSTTWPRPSARSRGSASGTSRAMLPSVLLPSSPYDAASGSSPQPTLSSTIRMTRENGVRSGLCREVVRHRARSLDRGDGVLEHQLIVPADFDDDGELVEVLDTCFEVPAVHQTDQHGDA